MVKDMSRLTNRFSPLENCTYGAGNDMFYTDDQEEEPETVSTASPIPLTIPNIPPSIRVLSEDPRRATEVKIRIQSPRTGATHAGTALLDSGATGMFMDPSFARDNKLDVRALPLSIPVYNVDGSLNEMGAIREEADVILHIGDHSERVTFSIIKLGKTKMIIGHTWLHHHNPEIDWKTGDVTLTRCPTDCRIVVRKACNAERRTERQQSRTSEKKEEIQEDSGTSIDEPEDSQSPVDEPDEADEEYMLERGDFVFGLYFPDDTAREELIRALSTPSQRLAEAAKKDEPPKTQAGQLYTIPK